MINQMEPWFSQEETDALYQYMQSGGWLTEHTKTREFEQMIADYVGAKHCIAVPNATVGLFLALKALGIGVSDEVIVPDFTMVATANAVVLAGATPVFVDIDLDNLCLNLDLAEQAITDRTRAIIVVSLNGRAPNMFNVFDFYTSHGIHFIEDSAQSLGSRWNGIFLGTEGDVGVYSFSSQKIISTGVGGAMITDDDETAKALRMMKDFGREHGGIDEYLTMGWNFKFTDLQAVVGIEQMKKLPWRVERKKEIFRLYQEQLKNTPVRFIPTNLEDVSPWFIDILAGERDELAMFLKEKNIGTRPFYPALHSQPVYNQSGHFPNSEYAAKHGLWLPSSSQLTNEQIYCVCDRIKEFYE